MAKINAKFELGDFIFIGGFTLCGAALFGHPVIGNMFTKVKDVVKQLLSKRRNVPPEVVPENRPAQPNPLAKRNQLEKGKERKKKRKKPKKRYIKKAKN